MSLVRIAGVVLGIAALSSVAYARKKDPEFATSANDPVLRARSEEHTSELQSPCNLVCRLLLEKKNHTGKLPSERSLSASVLRQEIGTVNISQLPHMMRVAAQAVASLTAALQERVSAPHILTHD